MAYGTLKVDNIIFTNGGVDQTVTISGIVGSISGDIVATGTIQGTTIIGTTLVSGATVTGDAGSFTVVTGVSAGFTTITGTTVTGTTANFNTGSFTSQISGATITGNTGQFTVLTGVTAGFTTVTGTTVTGATANFVTLSGTTVTGNAGQFTTLTGETAGFTTVTGTTITGTTANFATLSGTTITGNIGQFTSLNSASADFTTITGATITGTVGNFAAGSESAPAVSIGTTNNGIYSPGTNEVALSTNGTGRLFVDSSGRILINANIEGEPTADDLTIETAGQTGITIRSGSSSEGNIFFSDGTSGDAEYRGIIRYDHSYDGLTLYTAAQERLRITSAGLVGIGTSTPGTALDVNGAIRSNDIFTLYKNSTDAFYIGAGTIITGGTSTDIALRSNQNGSILFSTNGATERMRIDASGRVGIGSTSPRQALTFGGLTSSSTSTPDCIDLGATYTSTSASTNLKFKLYVDSSGNTYGFTVNGSSHLEYYAGTVSSPGNHVFLTGGSERARIDSSGRLLVGTSSARAVFNNTTHSALFQIEGASSSGGATGRFVSQVFGSSANADPMHILARHRSDSVGGITAVGSGDRLGTLSFQGSDGSEFVPAAEITAEVDGTPGANDMPGRLVFSTTADGASSPTEKLRIDNTGTIQADGRNGTATHIFYSILPSPGTSRNHFFANTVGVGTWALQGNGVSTFTSDVRRKKNIETARDGYLEDLAQLRVVKYNWNVQSDDEPKELGLIAQEVEQVFPGLVVEADEPQDGDDYNLKSVKFSVLPFMLLKALQEASSKIETLEAKVAALESA